MPVNNQGRVCFTNAKRNHRLNLLIQREITVGNLVTSISMDVIRNTGIMPMDHTNPNETNRIVNEELMKSIFDGKGRFMPARRGN